MPSAEALADDLDRYLADEPILARRTPLWERGLKWARRRPTTSSLLAIGFLIATILAMAGLLRPRAKSCRWTAASQRATC